MNIKSSFRILFQLATRIKWISRTGDLSIRNKEYLKSITYNDEFLDNSTTYPISVSAICQDSLVIYCCSFIDEYDRYLTPTKYPEESTRILKFKKIVLPAYKRIKKWKDLNKLRNNLLAHNHRINGKSIFDMEIKLRYNVPTTNGEYTLLADLLFLIATNIHEIFPEIISEMDLSKTLRDFLDIHSEKFDTSLEFQKIEEEIEKNKLPIIAG